jgi:hypothetical protein
MIGRCARLLLFFRVPPPSSGGAGLGGDILAVIRSVNAAPSRPATITAVAAAVAIAVIVLMTGAF